MFRPNWPPSGVQVVMVKDSAAHCNASNYDGRPKHKKLPPQQERSGQPQPVNQAKPKQPRAIQGHPYKTDSNPHNQNNQRQL
jgi:hypothetical protein